MEELIVDIVNPKLDKATAIREYLDENANITHYVVIDDDRYLAKQLITNFVLTTSCINGEQYKEAKKILQKN